MLQDWRGKQVVLMLTTEPQFPVEGRLTQVYQDVNLRSRLGIAWIEVDVTVGRPGLIRIAGDQIATARLLEA